MALLLDGQLAGNQPILKVGGDDHTVLEFDLQRIAGRRITAALLELNQLRYEPGAVVGVYALDRRSSRVPPRRRQRSALSIQVMKALSVIRT